MAEARETVVRTCTREQVEQSIRLPIHEAPYSTPGVSPQLALQHKMRIGSFAGPATGSFPVPRSNPIVSDTGELAWHTSILEQGLVTIDSPRTQALIGYVRDNGLATRHLVAGVENNFCALTLSSLEPRPIAEASRLLLVAGSRVENTGFRWNADRTDAAHGERGESPSLIEVVKGRITLRGLVPAQAVMVQPLDGAGCPLGAARTATVAADGWSFDLGDPATTWFTIEVRRLMPRTGLARRYPLRTLRYCWGGRPITRRKQRVK